MPRIVTKLKSTFACGGTAKDGFIMLQGDHRDDVKGFLVKTGFSENSIEFSNVAAELLPEDIYTKAFKPAGLKSVWCIRITFEDSEGLKTALMKR